MIEWDDNYIKVLQGQVDDNLERAGEYLAEKMKINVGRQGPPRSLPGEFPRRDTGDLQASIGFIAEDGTLSVGAYVDYALPLEYGTVRMAARPFIRQTFNIEAAKVAAIIGGA